MATAFDFKARRAVDLHAAAADPEASAPLHTVKPGKSATRLPPLDARSLDKLRESALTKARALQAAAAAAARDAIPASAGLAAGFAVPRARHAAPVRRPSIVVAVERSRTAALIARAAVASYYIHLVVQDLGAWSSTRDRAAEGRAVPFPIVGVCTALPAALCVIAGVRVPQAASVLALEMLAKSSRVLWIQALLVFQHGRAPSELVAKKLAMAGAAALVAVHPVAAGLSRSADDPRRDRGAASAAGPLLAAATVARRTGLATSLVLAIARALVATLFFVCGAAQLRRVAARGWRPWRSVPGSVAFEDGHDNLFILLEMMLAVPYALGWRLTAATRGLVATLLAEAAFCWPVWRPWPNPHFRAHVRSHFFVNVGVAAGLLLSRSHEGGAFAVDRLARRKSH